MIKEFIEMKNNMKLDNIVFVGFKTKKELKDYYIAADVFCLQTELLFDEVFLFLNLSQQD